MNLPNILTILRIIMIPFFVAAFLTAKISDWVTLSIFVIAAITDALDGYIARKQNIVTDFGKLMDPLADKLMVMAAFICFTAAGIIHPLITVFVMAREFFVTGLRSIATSKGKVIAADIWGKAKTVSQYTAIIVILVKSATHSANESFLGILAVVCIALMTALTLISVLNYCLKNKEFFKG
ncbi:MAG: CDP-diacylglycerol--glycerol-3-phosphate 3-phosphatidyltransferase [Oscillospiraceae bacterium]|nr:CDP-diacylglycerol--glycerol-3-phosphate 3-phosphatidyltransferase [Oscillospiraceae bacterium]MBR6657440.1 CDP-diacylglycerol--glycerol-3-phosphate 3-phosphatidyltransferase [Oscillospiraceae bacterium]